MLKKLAVFFVLFVFSLCGAANFTSTHGKLSVSDGKILNKNNQEIVLRGMSLYWYQGPWAGGQPGDQFYTSSVVSSLANDWNANVVRAAIGNVQQNPSTALSMARNMMDWANSAGVYVIIDNHSHIAHRSAHATAANNFFRDVSAYAKQKAYTHVIYEIYNEPVCDDDKANDTSCGPDNRTKWSQIKTYAQSVIATIRANDADGLIIVGTPSYSSSITEARLDPIANVRNVLYALHFYAATTAHDSYKTRLDSAYCNNIPIFVSEWGTSEASGAGNISTSNSNDWISLLEAAKVSYANWSYSVGETSAALSNANGSTTSSGSYVKNLFKLNTSGTSLSSVGLTTKTINCLAPPPQRNGRIKFGTGGEPLANYASISGADSVKTGNMAVLGNTSKDFTADYTLYGIEKPGTYAIRIAAASTAGGTVSWSGSGILSGQMNIENNASLTSYKYSEKQPITINQAPETPLRLSFKTPTANTLRAAYISITVADSADSVKFNLTTPVKSFIDSKKWNYNSATAVFDFEANEGTLVIYNLRGERKMLFAAKGSISVKEKLPAGTYLAIYRRNSQVETKTIFIL
jgi:endoglucanase